MPFDYSIWAVNCQFDVPVNTSIVKTSFAATAVGTVVKLVKVNTVPDPEPAATVGFELNTVVPFFLTFIVSPMVASEFFTTTTHLLKLDARGDNRSGPTLVPGVPLPMIKPITIGSVAATN